MLVLKLGIDSSLSIVPPVNPNPLPDILAMFTPHDATSGASISVVLSPTPPVECLSTTGCRLSRFIISPLFSIISVRLNVSSFVIPLMVIAISNELIW